MNASLSKQTKASHAQSTGLGGWLIKLLKLKVHTQLLSKECQKLYNVAAF